MAATNIVIMGGSLVVLFMEVNIGKKTQIPFELFVSFGRMSP